jgi:imidazolonepropionase-like amidohydrolase
MKKTILLALLPLAVSISISAQQTFHNNGVADERENYFAFTHASIVTDYQTMLKDATLIIRDGKIEAVGTGLAVPGGASEINLEGKYLYPSFLDIYSDYGVPEAQAAQQQGPQPPQFDTKKSGPYYWNQAVHPEVHAGALVKNDAEKAMQLRELGFGTVSTHQKDGIVRGTGVLVLLSDERENRNVLRSQSAEYYSFNKGVSTQAYPTSLMGSIALLRQTYLDAQWYKQSGYKEQTNHSLDELNKALSLPQVFEAGNVYSALRADRLGDEFGIRYIIKGSGDEYQRLDELKAAGTSMIIPLNFPKAYEVSDPYDAQIMPLSQLMHWEQAPANAAALEKAGIQFALTAADLTDKKDFLKNLRTAISYGLSQQAALRALTYVPATLMNCYDQVGSLEKGKIANFIICSDSVFSEKNVIYQNWVNGIQYVINNFSFSDLRGNYKLTAGNATFSLAVEGSLGQPEATVKVNDTTKLKASISTADDLVTISFHYPKDTSKTTYLLSGYVADKNLIGNGQDVSGRWIKWRADFQSANVPKQDEKKKTVPQPGGKVLYPFAGYGNETLPKQETILFRNATVWTNEPEGNLQNTDVLVSAGKIQKIGQNLPVPQDIRVVDATGKYLTSGIMDEHSHIAITQGVNECSHSVTAEVRIGDVIDPTDINIYRQLSGGVTSSHLLHGSCNSIGGQTQLIKLRWGYAPEAMKFEGWPGFIKFALGENVKTANWGDMNRIRFPQTRMGVEQTMYDAFIRAKEYKLSWTKYNSLSTKEKSKTFSPRRDLQLDALVEILEAKRFITCHSYVQSEINMLMHVADSMGFRVNTFTHILEGFKVADKMKEHGAFASNFSDWWTYKFEVYDAIPYNSAILTKVGVVTAVNSDDAEMARRLNQEAAKSVKYGGLNEVEAWKLCTLNPAKMLHVDDRVGSIKVGKDADLVLWNNNPLSIYAKVNMTLVDGIIFFSEQQDSLKLDWIQKERTRLINAMIQAKQNGAPTQKVAITYNLEWECETMTDGSGVN